MICVDGANFRKYLNTQNLNRTSIPTGTNAVNMEIAAWLSAMPYLSPKDSKTVFHPSALWYPTKTSLVKSKIKAWLAGPKSKNQFLVWSIQSFAADLLPKKDMKKAAQDLAFEKAVLLRDELKELQAIEIALGEKK